MKAPPNLPPLLSSPKTATRLLIIENDYLIVQELLSYLQDFGYSHIHTGKSVAEGLVLVKDFSFDLALLDIKLNEQQSGIDLAGILKEQYGIPSIFVSFYNDAQTIAQAKQVNPLGYLLKPIRKRELKLVLEIALGKAIGILVFDAQQYGTYSKQDFPLFQAIADQLAVAVANVLANEQLKARAEEKARELELIKALEGSAPLSEQLQALAHILRSALSYDMLSLMVEAEARSFCYHFLPTGATEFQVLDKTQCLFLLNLSEADYQQHYTRHPTEPLRCPAEQATFHPLLQRIMHHWQMSSALVLPLPLSHGRLAHLSLFARQRDYAYTDASVLVQGKTGTGKELITRAIHQASPQQNHLLVKINCAAIPEALFESELFGHKKGAFTGAVAQRKGKFELAHQGTIFLDELGELPLSMQAKLLRVLQEGEFERVGGNQVIKSNFRVVAATNRELLQAIEAGKFRADLYYRLSTFPIELLPLRERPEDIPLLAEHFARQYSRHIGVQYRGFSKAALRSLQHYDFPGNIRELRNMIEHAVIVSKGKRLDKVLPQPHSVVAKADFNGQNGLPPPEQITQSYIAEQKDAVERRALLKVLEATHWRVRGKQGAAKILGLVPTTLESRMKKLGIER